MKKMTAKHKSVNNVLWRVTRAGLEGVAVHMRPVGRQLDNPEIRKTLFIILRPLYVTVMRYLEE